MTPQERQLIDDLFDRLSKVESAPRDPDAVAAINEGLRKAPNAVYALVQTALLQDEALRRANGRIQELEAVVEKLNQREAELVTQLQEAKQRSADLEERLAAEKQHSARAEGLAAAVSARANELEQALWDANQNLETLGGALEVAFRGLPEATDRNLAAA